MSANVLETFSVQICLKIAAKAGLFCTYHEGMPSSVRGCYSRVFLVPFGVTVAKLSKPRAEN